jgi:hypothetical protein
MQTQNRFRWLFCAVIAMNWVAGSCIAAESNLPNPAARWQFELVHGRNAALCEAYAEGLNTVEFDEPPYCSRPQLPNRLGFEQLSRTPLSDAQIASLYPSVEGLLSYDDESHFYAPTSTSSPASRKYDLTRLVGAPQSAQRSALAAGRPPLYYLISPDTDVDGDGRADRLLVWRQGGAICGATLRSAPERKATHVVVLDADNRLDVAATRAMFTRYSARPDSSDQAARPEQRRSSSGSFEAFASSMGVVRFKGRTYIDTFSHDGYTLRLLDLAHRQISEVCAVRWIDAQAYLHDDGHRSADG